MKVQTTLWGPSVRSPDEKVALGVVMLELQLLSGAFLNGPAPAKVRRDALEYGVHLLLGYDPLSNRFGISAQKYNNKTDVRSFVRSFVR